MDLDGSVPEKGSGFHLKFSYSDGLPLIGEKYRIRAKGCQMANGHEIGTQEG